MIGPQERVEVRRGGCGRGNQDLLEVIDQGDGRGIESCGWGVRQGKATCLLMKIKWGRRPNNGFRELGVEGWCFWVCFPCEVYLTYMYMFGNGQCK